MTWTCTADLYRALREAGVSEELASTAAKSRTRGLPALWGLTGTNTALIALVLGMLWLQLGLYDRLAGIDAKVVLVQQQLLQHDGQFAAIQRQLEQQSQQIGIAQEQITTMVKQVEQLARSPTSR